MTTMSVRVQESASVDHDAAQRWLSSAFPGVRDVRVRSRRLDDGTSAVAASGVFCGTALAVEPHDGGWCARAVGVCPACGTLFDHPGTRVWSRLSRSMSVSVPAPALVGVVGFFRAYGDLPVDGPGPAVPDRCCGHC